ncbi:MAG TPA: DUF3108 domain-containing protein [Bryobacteraceae bacterium]|nr:DUF3108 domain-containing protein [Bryobacteraceae bacterium]
MKHPHAFRGLLLLLALSAAAAPSAAPAFENEQLHYNINWPSGLSLGEAQLTVSSGKAGEDLPPRLRFSFDIDAGIPGFSVTDRYHSEATSDFCSTEFNDSVKHGAKTAGEKLIFDSHAATVTRETAGSGKSEIPASACARDALTFLYYTRHELSQGRIPPPQTVFLGPQYQVRLEFAGTQSVQIADKTVQADRFTASVQGPKSNISFEIFFLKDRARTPALVRVPLALGTFSMELAQ